MKQISACNGFLFEEVSLKDALDEREAWEQLADHALEPNPFFEPAFLEPFATHLAGTDIGIARLRNPVNGDLAALVPIVSQRLGLGLSGKPARFFSHDYGPLATPLLHRDHAHDAALDLVKRLLSKRSLICAPHSRMNGPVFDCLSCAVNAGSAVLSVVGPYERAVQDARGSVDDYLVRALSKKRRRQYAKQMRRLEAKGTVRLESISSPEQLHSAFQGFLALEAAGWKGRGGSALRSRPDAEHFAMEMAAGFIEKRRMRADVLTVNEQLIGIVINLRAGREIIPWKMAFDETHRDVSPGMQTLLRTTEANCQDPDIDWVDSLTGPDSPTVDMLWKERRPMGTLVLMAGSLGVLKGKLLDFDKTAYDRLRVKAKLLLKRLR
ncbi:MAG: GNAT family N-acetyltransferase [Stappiaceae bacterium]